MLLEIKNLTIHYGSAAAVRNMSLSVDKGELVSLLGANGAGKSTLITTVMGLHNPTSGEILFEGERIDRLAPHKIIKRGISLVPESKMLFPYLTVWENLIIATHLRSDREAIDEDLSRIFDSYFPVLKERQKQLASTLSGGEQQMLAIGRALMQKPRLLLMDEPSLGLAPIMVNLIGSIIKTLNEQGISIMLVEQNINLAIKLAKRAYVMEVGELVAEGPLKSLMNDEHVKRSYLGISQVQS